MTYVDVQPSDSYTPDAETMEKLKLVKNLVITLVHGDWNSDSVYTLPLLKCIMSALPEAKITEIQVAKDFLESNEQTKVLGVTAVPTLIVTRNDIEKGRIVESAKTTLEGDILAAVESEMPYTRYVASDWYIADEEVVKELQERYKHLSVTLFHADWCADCTYSIPLLKKLHESLPTLKVTDVIVNREKKDTAGKAEALKID